jgi:hypothetical protein
MCYDAPHANDPRNGEPMSTLLPLVIGLGLMGFGAAVLFFPTGADDPYRDRRFAFAKGSAAQIVIGGIALMMGVTQLVFWFRAHF